MSVRVRGGMFCDRCQMPVAAVRSTSRIRNLAALGSMPITGGVSAAGARRNGWCCPTCGGPVRRLPTPPASGEDAVAMLGGGLFVLFWIVVFVLIVLAGLAAIVDTIIG
jgi:hypothetical protein